jgi:hypothetical protein
MIEIIPGAVRDLVRKMKENGASPYVIDKAKVILGAIFTTALNDQIVFLHACKGVKVPPTPRKPLTIVTPPHHQPGSGKASGRAGNLP